MNLRVGYQQAPIYSPSLQPENTFMEDPIQQEQRYMHRSNSAHFLSNQVHPLQRSSETIQHKQESIKSVEAPSPVAEKPKPKATTMKKPLYEKRSITPEPQQQQQQQQSYHHHHHHHHHKEYIEPSCPSQSSISKCASHTNIPDTPPPESHSRHSVETTIEEDENLPPSPASIHSNLLPNDVGNISETKEASSIQSNQRSTPESSIDDFKERAEVSATSTVDQDDIQQDQEIHKNKTDSHSETETVAASETSKKSTDLATQDEYVKESKTGIYRMFQLPSKLKQELRGVQMRRTSYSVPDLTAFTKQDDDSSATLTATHWSEIESIVPLKKVENTEIKIHTNEQTKSIQTEREERPQEFISHSRESMHRTMTPSVSRIDLHNCCPSTPVSCCQRGSHGCHNGSDHHYFYASQNHGCNSCSHKHSNHSSSCSSNNSYCQHKTKSCMKKSTSICSAMKLDHHSMMSHSQSQQHLHGHHCSKKRNKHRHSSDRHESSHRLRCSQSRYRMDESHLLEDAGGY
jgi:hypothetical protein